MARVVKHSELMRGLLGLVVIVAAWAGAAGVVGAEQPKVRRVGVIQHGGPYYAVVDGLRDGLRELGLEEGKHFVLEIRETKGDLKAVEEAAKALERAKVDLIFSTPSSVTVVVKRATVEVPIVFAVGTDPVVTGLVQSFAKPGGRLTGVHFQTTDLTGKRLELLKRLVPKLRRAVTFYDPQNRVAREAARAAREASHQLGVELLERHVGSVAELQAALGALKADEADAFFLVSDAMVISQAPLIIETAKAKRLATMFWERSLVEKGALAAYGVNFHGVGRQSAKHVQRVLTGTPPADLPVENFDRLEFVVNVRTARELRLTIPPELRMLVDRVIE